MRNPRGGGFGLKGLGGAESGSLAPPNALSLEYVDYEGQPSDRDGDRTTNPCEIRRLLTPHPQRPRATGFVGGGADLSYERGERANAREHSTDAESKVPSQGPTVKPKYCSSILPGPDRFPLYVPSCLEG